RAKQDALNDTDGFADSLPAMQRQRVVNALNANVSRNGKIVTRKQAIRDMVAAGSRVGESGECRAMLHTDGSYTLEKNLSKTALNYADHITKGEIASAAHQAATCPLNDLPAPTEAQK